MSFGARLAAARKDKGLTQSELGKGLGTDGKDAGKAVVYGWEKDQHFPRADQLALICERLGVSSDYLLFGTAHEASLPPEISELAAEISAMPALQREFVLGAARSSIKVSEAALQLRDNRLTDERSVAEPERRISTKRARRG